MSLKDVLREVAHTLYSHDYAKEYEEWGGSFLGGGDITEHVPRLEDSVSLPVIYRWAGSLEQAWGHGLVEMLHILFDASDATSRLSSDARRERFLSAVFLNQCGAGVDVFDGEPDIEREWVAMFARLSLTPDLVINTYAWWELAVDHLHATYDTTLCLCGATQLRTMETCRHCQRTLAHEPRPRARRKRVRASKPKRSQPNPLMVRNMDLEP